MSWSLTIYGDFHFPTCAIWHLTEEQLRGIKILKAPQCSCLTPLPVIATDPGHRTLSIAMKTDGKCPPPLVLPMEVQGLVGNKVLLPIVLKGGRPGEKRGDWREEDTFPGWE